jgi:hypothetical protein
MVRTPVLTAEQTGESGAGELAGSGPDMQARCPACGAPLAQDQEWCLECGAARTAIHAPPDWRIGLLIMLAVIAVVAIVAAIVWP